MKLEVWINSPPAEWDERVGRLGASIYQSTVWAHFQRRTLNVVPIYFIGLDSDGSDRACVIAFMQKSRWPIASLLLRSMRLPSHPTVRDATPQRAGLFVAALERKARLMGCSRIAVESFMSGDSAFVPADHGYSDSVRLEFHLDLTRDLESLWNGIGKDQRDKIKRLSKQGVTIEEGQTLDDLRGLALVREATHAKRSARQQGYELEANESFYEVLFESLMSGGAGRLFLARQGEEVIGALFFSVFNGRAYSVFSGSTDAGYRLGAQGGIFWHAVQTFHSERFTLMNRGGVPASAVEEDDPQHGIYSFKKRLGTTPTVCRSGDKVLIPILDGLAQLRSQLRRTARSEQ